MDEIAVLLKAIERPRSLPPEVRSRLALTLSIPVDRAALEPGAAARAIPTHVRVRIWGFLVTGQRKRLGPSPLLRWVAAGAAAAVLALGLFSQRSSVRPPLQTRTLDTEAPPGPSRVAPSPSASVPVEPPDQLGRVFVAAGKGEPGSVSIFTEICFPGEECPKERIVGRTRTRRPPRPPSDVSVERGPGLGEATLTWRPPEDQGSMPLKKYGVFRSDEDGDEELIAIRDGGVTSYRDMGLSPLAVYRYRVKARSFDGISEFSNAAELGRL